MLLAHCEWAEIIIGDTSKEMFIQELERQEKLDDPKKSINVQSSAKFIINSPAFIVSKELHTVKLARVKVSDLDFTEHTTLEEIYKRAQELGLELCPPEVGLLLGLYYDRYFKKGKLRSYNIRIGMEPMMNSLGNPEVLNIRKNKDNSVPRLLKGSLTGTGPGWSPDEEFVFVHK